MKHKTITLLAVYMLFMYIKPCFSNLIQAPKWVVSSLGEKKKNSQDKNTIFHFQYINVPTYQRNPSFFIHVDCAQKSNIHRSCDKSFPRIVSAVQPHLFRLCVLCRVCVNYMYSFVMRSHRGVLALRLSFCI